MVWKPAPLAAPDVIQRPSTPQWAPPRPAIMPPLTSSGLARGDCGTVQLQAEACLEAHLNANLIASREADNVKRVAVKTTVQPTGRLRDCCGRHGRGVCTAAAGGQACGRRATGPRGRKALVLVFPDLRMFRGQAGVRERPQRQRQPQPKRPRQQPERTRPQREQMDRRAAGRRLPLSPEWSGGGVTGERAAAAAA